ncbi:MAG: DUF1559 domain-containing protein [Gemmataceae bacterium]|nr:DUF1559 domain-containing protein [Gemmataceae bacterium]
MRPSRSQRRRGVTFIELLIVIGGLLVLAAIWLPAVAQVRRAATRAQSQNNLRQLALATHNFHDTHNAWPPAVGRSNVGEGPAHFHLLPYLEQDNLFRQAQGAPWKNRVYGTVIPLFLDPADTSGAPDHVFQGWLATTNYPGNWLVLRTGDKRIQDTTDGTSNTLLFTTRYQMCNGEPTGWGYPFLYRWAPIFAHYTTAKFQVQPKQQDCDPTVPQSLAGAQIMIGLCDGSVRMADSGVSPRTWHHLCDPADGNPLDNDF